MSGLDPARMGVPLDGDLCEFVIGRLQEQLLAGDPARATAPAHCRVGNTEVCLATSHLSCSFEKIEHTLSEPARVTALLTSPASPVVTHEGPSVYDVTTKVIGFKSRTRVQVFLEPGPLDSLLWLVQPVEARLRRSVLLLCFLPAGPERSTAIAFSTVHLGHLPIPKFMIAKGLAKSLEQLVVRFTNLTTA